MNCNKCGALISAQQFNYSNGLCGACDCGLEPRMEEPKLLPCPFCGKYPNFWHSSIKGDNGSVQCANSFCACYEAFSVEEWNTRPKEERKFTREEVFNICKNVYYKFYSCGACGRIIDQAIADAIGE